MPATPKISELRQTCRLRVSINGEDPIDTKLLIANQRSEGLNFSPVGDEVHLEGQWHKSEDVEVISVLPWKEDD